MDQDRRTPPPPPRTGSNPHATTSSGLSVRGSPSSAMLGLSSPASPHRRFSPSLYPPPAPSPGRLASGSGSGSGSASRFGQIPPSSPVAAPGGRQRRTHALPSPFLSELASIRRMGASLFGDLDDARPTNHHRGASATPQAAIHGQQPQQQAWPSPTLTMSRDSGLRTPPPSGSFPQVAPPPVSRQQQPPSPGRPPLSSNRFAGFPASAFWSQPRRQVQSSSSGVPPPLALQQQQTTYHPDPSSTDLAPLPSGSGSIFSKSSFTDLAPPLPGETTMFGSSSWSSSAQLAPDTASHTVAMYSHAQSSSDSELQPLPPSLQMQSPDQTPSWQWKFSGNGSSSSTYSDFEAPILDVAVGLGPRFQIKEEPVDFDAPCTEMQPELISLDDDDDDDGLDALLQSFKSSTEPATSSEGSLQLGGSGSRPSVLGIIDEGSGQSWDWDIAKQNLQFPLLPSPTDRLELNSSHGPSVWSTGDTSGQGWAGMPALASMFDQMSIAGGTMSIGQGWPAMPAAAGQYAAAVPGQAISPAGTLAARLRRTPPQCQN
ncbi:hypothetical protein C2845_PM03G31290 [Panicum miliaceum]|uniref:Uncharacterized protein n=1 Tax=Panicum miliaceum TaxID=4540 RepID=A0A3L6TAT1_PANMI|nr:hypothetical protein C2845_PM03G31290 [Panicum miliaceum]